MMKAPTYLPMAIPDIQWDLDEPPTPKRFTIEWFMSFVAKFWSRFRGV